MNDLELARFIAQGAGELLMKVRTENQDKLHTRELGDLADKLSQGYIAEQIHLHRPEDSILSEEALDDLNRLGKERVWIIDPLDGTKEFSTDRADFAVHIALWEKSAKESVSNISTAVVGLPATKQLLDTGETFKQAKLTRTPRVVISRTRPPDAMKPILQAIEKDFGAVETIPLGSVGAKVAQLILGNAEAYVHTTGFYEWDVAAPLAVAAKYGFHVSDTKNSQLLLNKENTRVENLLICHPDLTQTLLAVL